MPWKCKPWNQNAYFVSQCLIYTLAFFSHIVVLLNIMRITNYAQCYIKRNKDICDNRLLGQAPCCWGPVFWVPDFQSPEPVSWTFQRCCSKMNKIPVKNHYLLYSQVLFFNANKACHFFFFLVKEESLLKLRHFPSLTDVFRKLQFNEVRENVSKALSWRNLSESYS